MPTVPTATNPTFDSTEHTDTMLTLLKSRNVVLFVGSGPSTDIPPYRCGYPSWTQLVKDLCHACGIIIGREQNLKDPAVLKRLACEAKQANSDAYHNQLRECFSSKCLSAIPRIYTIIAKAKAKSYVTTNFDPLLRIALADVGMQGEYYIHIYTTPDFRVSEVSRRGVFYIHGLIGDVEGIFYEQVILTETEFQSAYNEIKSDLPRFWHTMLRENDVIFIGTKLSDASTKHMIDRCHIISTCENRDYNIPPRRHFILLDREDFKTINDPAIGSSPNDSDSQSRITDYLLDRGLTPILYDKGDRDHIGLLNLLESVVQTQPLSLFKEKSSISEP